MEVAQLDIAFVTSYKITLPQDETNFSLLCSHDVDGEEMKKAKRQRQSREYENAR